MNTIKTAFGYLVTMLRKAGVIKLDGASIERIYNYVHISERLSTSGQPSALELRLIRAAGFNAVINLAPHNAENSLNNEADIVADLGMQYIHIPVDFKNPTEENFSEFAEAMRGLTERNIWIHCAANMRVSAFVYRYRREVLGVSEETALNDLRKIWRPSGVWSSFISGQHTDT